MAIDSHQRVDEEPRTAGEGSGFSEAGAWETVAGGWRILYGGFHELGYSIEWQRHQYSEYRYSKRHY